MARKSWFSITAKAGNAEIFVFDEIGLFGVTAGDFAKELQALGDVKVITVRINSPGGVVFDALAIFNMLVKHPATVNVRVEGIAASAASVIAMAGDKITMPRNTFLMLHNPLGAVVGDATEHAEMAAVLEKITNSLINLYSTRSGQPEEEVRRILNAESWLSAEEAVAAGFADELVENIKIAASLEPGRFQNAPPELIARESAAGPDEEAERLQHATIAEICAAAGDMALAVSAIEASMSIADVEALLEERAEKRQGLEAELAAVRGKRGPTRTRGEISASWDAAIARVNATRQMKG